MPRIRDKTCRRRTGSRQGSRTPTAALRAAVRLMVEEIVAARVGDLEARLDYLESEASLADGEPVPAEAVWKRLGLS